jgi:2-methylisocitrate lyase-like PEP mutase family enzyme
VPSWWKEPGFEATYLTSYGVTAVTLCKPDMGLITLSEMVTQAKYISQAVRIPIIFDGEAGFGNAINTIRMVKEVEKAGASGTDLQDQRFPRIHRFGAGEKELVPTEEHVKKIKAALQARESEEFIIIGRTEASNLEEAIGRLKAYADAGADLVFAHSRYSVSELQRIAQVVEAPMIINYSLLNPESNRLPRVSELTNSLFRIVLFPISALFAATKISIKMLNQIKADGTDSGCDMSTFEEFDEIVGAYEVRSWEEKYMCRKYEKNAH